MQSHPRHPSTPLFRFLAFGSFVGVFFLACAPSGSEELASFDGGKVLRSEMRSLMILELGPDAKDQASIAFQSKKLRQIGLLKIVALDFKKQKSNSDFEAQMQRFRKLHELEARQLSYTYLLKKNADDFRLPMVELQFLYLKQAPDAPSRKTEAEEYLKKLNDPALSRADKEDFIQKKSEHGRYKWLGGYLEPICLICDSRSPLLGIPSVRIQKLLQGKDGRFALLARPNDYLIVREVNQKEITLDELEDYQLSYFRKTMRLAHHYAKHAPPPEQASARRAAIAQNEEQLERVNYQISKRRRQDFLNRIMRIRIEELRAKLKFKWELRDPKTLAELLSDSVAPDTVLFRIQEKPYTKKELLVDLKELGLDGEKPESLSSILNGILIPYKLLEHDELFREAKDSKNYAFFRKMIELREISKSYFSTLAPPRVTEKEIVNFYKMQKGLAKPLDAQLKKQIRGFLLTQKKNKEVQKKAEELARSYKLTVKTKLLKPNVL